MAAESNTTSAAIAESNNNNNNNSTTAAIAESNNNNNNNHKQQHCSTRRLKQLPTDLLSYIGCFCTIGDITQSLTLVFKNQAFWALRICNIPESEKEFDFQAVIRRCWQSAEEEKQRQYKLVTSYLSRVQKLCCTLKELAIFIQHTPNPEVTQIHVIDNMTKQEVDAFNAMNVENATANNALQVPTRKQVFQQWSRWREIEEIHCLFTQWQQSSDISKYLWPAMMSQAHSLRALKLESQPLTRSFPTVPTQLLRTNSLKQIQLHAPIEPQELMTCLKHKGLEGLSLYDNQSVCQALQEALKTPSKQTMQSNLREVSVKRIWCYSWPSLLKLCRFPLLQKVSLSFGDRVQHDEVEDFIQPTMTQLLHLNELAVDFEYIEGAAIAAGLTMMALAQQQHRSERFVLAVHINDVMVGWDDEIEGTVPSDHEFYTLFYLQEEFQIGPLIKRLLDNRTMQFTLKVSGNSHALKANDIRQHLQRWNLQEKVILKYEAFHSTECSAAMWSESCKTEMAEYYDRWVFETRGTL